MADDAGARAIKKRLQELARERWEGKLAGMARALHLPQPAVWKMVQGDQPVNAQLLMALARHAKVNLNWLVSGRGPRYLEGAAAVLGGAAVARPRLPVARKPLPGPPGEHAGLLADPPVDPLEGVFRPTQYWLRIGESDAVVRHQEEQLRPGDWLLLETDRACFLPERAMLGELVVVACPDPAPREARLARVEESSEAGLAVDTFDLGVDPALLDEEIVLRLRPGRELQAFRRTVVREETTGRGGRRFSRTRPARADEVVHELLGVRYEDILAVCVLQVRRL
jgi:hypothetical protein